MYLDGINNYLDCAAADCVDLDFTNGDYSIACWFNLIDTSTSEMLIGRYGLDLDGWELYWYIGGGSQAYMTLRHSHASLAPAPTRTACYSAAWTAGQWWFLTITRSGLYPKHYRNGEELTVSYSAGGLQDPDTCNRDLVIGTRYTKDTNWFRGGISNLRLWNRELTKKDHINMYKAERHWYNV